MDAIELRAIVAALGISQIELARLIEVTPRAVSLWFTEGRGISGPVATYLRLLSSLPRAMQAKEIARIRQEDPSMYEGMFSFAYQGRAGNGLGALILANGVVFGSDGGVRYDGTYQPSTIRAGYVDVHLRLTVPPGVPLVVGVPPQPMAYGFDVDCSFACRGQTNVNVQTPYGSVQGTISFLRTIPT